MAARIYLVFCPLEVIVDTWKYRDIRMLCGLQLLQTITCDGNDLMVTRRTSIGLLLAVTMLVIGAAALTPRIGQPQSYHTFADQRRWLGIPNFGDVVSQCPIRPCRALGLVVPGQADSRPDARTLHRRT